MQNDMGEGMRPLGVDDLEKVKSLWRFQVSRAKAENWAFRDMVFLVYDDTTDECDSDDEDAMLQKALEMSTKPPMKPPPLSYRPQNHGADYACRICSGIPEFPVDRKARTFRLFRPSDILPTLLENRAVSVDVCTHYVAVSYCWPEQKVEFKGNSLVRDLDDDVRPARATDDVLDRAVDFANCHGLRMIWIDQECLPQPDENSTMSEEDKEYLRLGVQAMDIVYNKATVTAGLHSGTIETQQQADALAQLIDFKSRGRPVSDLSHQLFDQIFEFFHMVISDRWYTRMWVVQEAISAGEGLVLAFRRGAGVQYPSSFRAGRSHDHRPRHSLDSDSSSFASDLILVHVSQFRDIVSAARTLLLRDFSVYGDVLLAEDQRRYPTLDRAESLHPKISASNQIPIRVHGGNQYGSRQRVNASTALTFLRGRQGAYQQDRITVVANMCAYEIRLDANEIARNCDSVRMGVLALALLNGDTSILVPEVYAFPDNEAEETSGLGRGMVSPFDTDPGFIMDQSLMKGYLQMPRICKHALGDNLTEGLRLSAYVWTVDGELDCSVLKDQFAERWHQMKCLAFRIDRRKDESELEYGDRLEKIKRHFSQNWRMRMALDEIFLLGSISPDSVIWNGLDPAYRDFECFAQLQVARVRHDPRLRDEVAEIFFAILLFLATHPDPRAKPLADSIWQSVRVDMVDKHRPDLPDEVNDALFNHYDVLNNPFATLKLGQDSIGGFRQTWFIDRIMQNGALWIGRYQRAPAFQPSIPGAEGWPSRTTEDSSLAEFGHPEMTPEVSQTLLDLSENTAGIPEERPDPGEGSSSTALAGSQSRAVEDTLHFHSEIPLTVDYDGVRLRDSGEETLLMRQLRLQLSTTAMSLDMFMRNRNDVSPNFNAGSMTYFLDGHKRGIWSAEAEEARVQSLVAAFDVDGPCTVATPYNSEWEVLPHPDLRSMSSCWVVELIDRSNKRKRSASDATGTSEEPRTKVNGKGKERMDPMESPYQGDLQPNGKGKEIASSPEAEMTEEIRLMMEFEEWSRTVPLYRVVHKVKGLRQLMDLPLQEFCFV